MKKRKQKKPMVRKQNEKVYYRLNEIAQKFCVSQEVMSEILKKHGIKEVLAGIYDRDSFRGKVVSVKRMVSDYKKEYERTHVKSPNPDGYMNIKEIAMIFETDVSCIRRKINRLKLPFIHGIRGEKRYHDVVIDKYAHILKRGSKLPYGKNSVLRAKGYIPYSEFEVLAGITRVTLRNRVYQGVYTDCIMSGNVCYIHRRNLNVQPVRNSSILSDAPDGYIPLVTIRKILNLTSLSIQKYIDDGIVNPIYVERKSGHVYLKREEADKFIRWYEKDRSEREARRNNWLRPKSGIVKGAGVVFSDYDIIDKI